MNKGMELQLFGSFALRVQGLAPHLRARAEQWILALLVLRRNVITERALLAATLWPDTDEEHALFNLRRNLSDLRRGLGDDAWRLLSPTSRTLRFDLSDVCCDLVAFDAAIARHDREGMECAVTLYCGPLLEGCHAPWILPERKRREQEYLNALEGLASYAGKQGNLTRAVTLLQQVVTQEPTRESTQRKLMQALAVRGDTAAVADTYRRFRRYLRAEMNAEPAPETTPLYRELLTSGRRSAQAQAACQEIAWHEISAEGSQRPSVDSLYDRRPDSDDEPQPFRQHSTAPPRLPQPLTPLIGREKERQQILDCIRYARLITLTGAGGVGKTRLALAAGGDAAGTFDSGVRWVELAGLADPALLPQAVVEALHLPGEPGIEALQRFLADKSLLLVLDNCEHLLEGCAGLIEYLLSGCPDLRVLTTSRQPLGLIGEVVWRVPSLSLPPISVAPDAVIPDREQYRFTEIMNSEAVRLFATRAQAVNPNWNLTERNSTAVVLLCRLLDGIPYAIELAAAWVRFLPVEQVAKRLQSRLLQLTSNSRTAPPRQQTLRAMMDWSFSLLSAEEQQMLRSVAIFAEGWTLEAAEAVCPPTPTLPLLAQLVDKSLVVYEEAGERGRYRLLETTRQYAREQCAPELQTTLEQRHAEYYRDWALRTAEIVTKRTAQFPSPESMQAERDNVLASRLWWKSNDKTAWLELTLALYDFGLLSYHSQEAREYVASLTRNEALPATPLHVRFYHDVGRWADWLGDLRSACRIWEQGLTMATACHDLTGGAAIQLALGQAALERNDYADAQRQFERSLAGYRKIDSPLGVTQALREIADLAFAQGDREQAHRLLQQNLEVGRCCNDWRIQVDTLDIMGRHAYWLADYEQARMYWGERLSLLQQHRWRPDMPGTLAHFALASAGMGDYEAAWATLNEALAQCHTVPPVPLEGWVHNSMARVALRQGDDKQAYSHLHRGLAIFMELGETASAASLLRKLALIAVRRCELGQAASLIGYCEISLRRNGWNLSHRERDEWEAQVTRLRLKMSPDIYSAAVRRGELMTQAEAIQLTHIDAYMELQ